MDIDKAKELKRGARVACPADRGSGPFTGTVTHVGVAVHKSLAGVEYIWVHVRGFGSEAVWPSNRLG